MPYLKTYDIFISHAWKYSNDYKTLHSNIKNFNNFKSRNYSVPEHDPLIDPNTVVGITKLINLIDNQIRPVNIVLIISGMYAAHSFWIKKEIEIALKYNKPILSIEPRGQQRIPTYIQNAHIDRVGWITPAIISKIRAYAL